MHRIDSDGWYEIYQALRKLPRFHTITCGGCSAAIRHIPPAIYATCPKCGRRSKMRSYCAGPDIEDIIDLVVIWLGTGPERDAIMAQIDDDWSAWDNYFKVFDLDEYDKLE